MYVYNLRKFVYFSDEVYFNKNLVLIEQQKNDDWKLGKKELLNTIYFWGRGKGTWQILCTSYVQSFLELS